MTARTIPAGTLVLMVGQKDTKAAAVQPGDGAHECLVGSWFSLVTTWARVAPADEVDVLTFTGEEDGVEVRRYAESVFAHERRMWLARVAGVYVGLYKTKREALAAAGVAAGVLDWHAQAEAVSA